VGKEGTALNHPLLHEIGGNGGRKGTASNHYLITTDLEKKIGKDCFDPPSTI
jgi:hypothetical protein